MRIKGILDPMELRTVRQLQFRTEGHSWEMKKLATFPKLKDQSRETGRREEKGIQYRGWSCTHQFLVSYVETAPWGLSYPRTPLSLPNLPRME